MNRWAVLKRNTTWSERLSLGLVGALFLFMAVLGLDSSVALTIFVVGIGAFGAPWLVRDQLVEHCERVSRGLRMAWFAMIGISIVGRIKRDAIAPDMEMIFAVGLFALIALYMGVYFWLYSDERIERRFH